MLMRALNCIKPARWLLHECHKTAVQSAIGRGFLIHTGVLASCQATTAPLSH